MQESVVKATGVSFAMSPEKIRTCIWRPRLTPTGRDAQYNVLGTHDRDNRSIPVGAE
jgi:hypothetical protein